MKYFWLWLTSFAQGFALWLEALRQRVQNRRLLREELKIGARSAPSGFRLWLKTLQSRNAPLPRGPEYERPKSRWLATLRGQSTPGWMNRWCKAEKAVNFSAVILFVWHVTDFLLLGVIAALSALDPSPLAAVALGLSGFLLFWAIRMRPQAWVGLVWAAFAYYGSPWWGLAAATVFGPVMWAVVIGLITWAARDPEIWAIFSKFRQPAEPASEAADQERFPVKPGVFVSAAPAPGGGWEVMTFINGQAADGIDLPDGHPPVAAVLSTRGEAISAARQMADGLVDINPSDYPDSGKLSPS